MSGTGAGGQHSKARLIPSGGTIEQNFATLTTRPVKTAFLIGRDATAASLARYIEYNSIIWGGYFNPFIPIDGNSIRADWWDTLLNHDPDKIVFCCQSGDDLTREVIERVQPYALYLWDDEATSHRDGTDQFRNMPMLLSAAPHV